MCIPLHHSANNLDKILGIFPAESLLGLETIREEASNLTRTPEECFSHLLIRQSFCKSLPSSCSKCCMRNLSVAFKNKSN